MVTITIQTNGINEVVAKLDGNVARSRDLTVPMKAGSLLMMGSVDRNFTSSGRPSPWKPLSPKYLTRKVSQGYSPKPLLKGGVLRGSIARDVDRMGFKLGTSVVYARIHQQGGKAGRKHAANIPARPYLLFQEEDLQEINKIVADYIKRGE